MSDATYYCYVFGLDVRDVTVENVSAFDSVADYFLGFLFNQMGNALSFKFIFDEIESDIKQQYYPDIAFQYGKLIKLVLDFEPVDDATLATKIPGVS
jgi:hypothetical protein